MKRQKYFMFFLVAFVLSAIAIAYPTRKASAHGDDSHFIAESSLLAGLAPGAVFPFIDTTPHQIAQARHQQREPHQPVVRRTQKPRHHQRDAPCNRLDGQTTAAVPHRARNSALLEIAAVSSDPGITPVAA